MNVAWSDHALVRAKQRGPDWATFRTAVERAIEARDWEEWFEVDPRENRGLRTNLVVRSPDGTAAVVRLVPSNDCYLVVSVLTSAQYEFNAERLWFITKAGALAQAHRQRREGESGLSPTTAALKFSPFAGLKVKP